MQKTSSLNINRGWMLVALVLLAIVPSAAFALPWEAPLQQIADSLSGPVAKGLAIIAFVIAGFMLAFGEAKGVFSLMLRVIFGISMALMAAQWLAVFT